MHKILCVDDSPEIQVVVQQCLPDMQVHTAETLAQANHALTQQNFSLVLLDLVLPDGSGFEVLAKYPDLSKTSSVFFLTAKSDYVSKVSAFSLGADDYIEKPFDPKELRLRIEAKLRKLDALRADRDILKVGPVTCHRAEQRLYTGDGRTVDLTSVEFRIFNTLATTQQKIFSRPEILARVWGENITVTERVVDVHISHLRKKLVEVGLGIEAITGSGYRLTVQDSASQIA